MSEPFEEKIDDVDEAIGEFIGQIEEGKAPNPAKLLHIESELKNLVENEQIPEEVKKSLEMALNKLSSEAMSKSRSALISLYGAKLHVDQAQGKSDD